MEVLTFFTFTEEYTGVIESFITWCKDNYLKINIGKNNKTLVDDCCMFIRESNSLYVKHKVPAMTVDNASNMDIVK